MHSPVRRVCINFHDTSRYLVIPCDSVCIFTIQWQSCKSKIKLLRILRLNKHLQAFTVLCESDKYYSLCSLLSLLSSLHSLLFRRPSVCIRQMHLWSISSADMYFVNNELCDLTYSGSSKSKHYKDSFITFIRTIKTNRKVDKWATKKQFIAFLHTFVVLTTETTQMVGPIFQICAFTFLCLHFLCKTFIVYFVQKLPALQNAEK